MGETDDPIEAVLDDIEDAAGDDTVTLGTLLDSFEDRSLGAVLLIFGVLVATPVVGAVPGLPDVAALVVLIAVGHSFIGGQRRFWAPETLRRREIEASKVRRALERVRPVGRWVDRWVVNDRLGILVGTAVARWILALVAAGIAVLVGILSLVPFGAVPPALAWVLLGIALMGRDGAFALLGYLFVGGSCGLLAYVWGAIF